MPRKRKKSKSNLGSKKRKGSTGLEKAITDYLKGKSNIKLNRVFGHFIKRYNQSKIADALGNLEQKNRIDISDTGFVSLKGKRSTKLTGNTVTGKVDLTQTGNAYVIVEELEADIFVPKRHTLNALSGDMVEVDITRFKTNKPEGVITRILKRKQNEFIGVVQKSKDFAFVVPIGGKVPFDIFVPIDLLKKADNEDVVLVEIKKWNDDKDGKPVGKVLDILTANTLNDIEMKGILLDKGFNLAFPADVMQETETIEEEITKQEIAKRIDMRDVLTFTIDPHDAKDFDDAISLKEMSNGNYEIGVHIADVSHYVRPYSALDIEAQYRATSVYLPDRVCPMLPEKLSNKVCSLRPNEEKLAFSVLFEFNPKFKIEHITVAKTVICSDKRFTYEDAQAILEADEGEYKWELDYVNKVAHHLRKKRFKAGSINFDVPEVRFKLDDQGYPIDVYVKERKDAHLLVEDFMLLANVTVAKYVSKLEVGKKKRDMVFRVHDKPSEEKLGSLSEVAKKFGHSIAFKDPSQTKEALENFMQQLAGKPEKYILEQMAVRSMAKAEYTTDNIGHYGLGFEYYSHFTSPIRRYPDVLAHRIVYDALNKRQPEYTKEELEELCTSSSQMERKAQEAEREAIKYKQVEFLQDKIGETYQGIISGVIARGFFVEILSNRCEGFIDIDSFSEVFAYDEQAVMLKSVVSDNKFQLGDLVTIKVVKTNLKKRQIDFDLVE